MTHVYQTTHDQSAIPVEPGIFKRLSWGAIFAGLTAAVITQLLLTLLGVGIGAASVNPLQEQSPGEGLGIGAMIWLFVSSIIAMYIGGRVAGRFSNATTRHDRMMHGVFTWAATTILSAVFLASALSSLLGSAAGNVAESSVQAKSSQPGAQPPVAVNEQQTRQAGEVAAKRVSQSALGTFFVLLLSGLAAAIGARNSAPRLSDHDHVRDESHTHVAQAYAKS